MSKIDVVLYIVGLGILLLAPGLIGVFWGAPLVTREVAPGCCPARSSTSPVIRRI